MSEFDTFRHLTDTAPDGIFIAALNGHLVYANSTMTRLTGYALDQLDDMKIEALVAPDYLEAVLSDFGRAAAGKEVSNRLHSRLLRIDGSPVDVVFTFGSTRWENGAAVVCIVRDVTLRRATEQALRESERRVRAIIDNTPGCVYHYEVVDGIRSPMLYVGPGLAEILGPNLAESLGNTAEKFLDLIHPDDFARLSAQGVFDPRSAEPVDVEYRVRTEDGTYKWIRSIARPHETDSSTVRWHGLFQDINARRQAEERLLRMDRIETVGTIAGGVSHEVYNALYPALVYLDKLTDLLGKDEPLDREKVARFLASCRAAIGRAVDMTQSITKFARIAADDTSQLIVLRTFVESLLGDYAAIKDRPIAVALEIDSAIAVEMNPSHIASLLGNLIGNAIDALKDTAAPSLRIAAAATDTFLRLSVTDNGPGIDSATAGHIFEPFFTTKADAGTGLGLAICRRIVDLYRGEITVESTPGESTTFTITLPQ